MNAQWLALSARLDAMSLRERVAVLVGAAALLGYLLFLLVLDPQLARHRALTGQIKQLETQAKNIDGEIALRMQAAQANPDQAVQQQIAELNRQSAQLSGSLRTMQHGLVAPDKVPALLQQLVQANGRLKLVSLRTLPVSGAGGAAGTGIAGEAKPAPAQRELLYRHGVEVVLEGSYLDMLDYLEALENSPQQVLWGRAQLDASRYPASTLTLTLYTLGLDEKWMTL